MSYRRSAELEVWAAADRLPHCQHRFRKAGRRMTGRKCPVTRTIGRRSCIGAGCECRLEPTRLPIGSTTAAAIGGIGARCPTATTSLRGGFRLRRPSPTRSRRPRSRERERRGGGSACCAMGAVRGPGQTIP